MKILNHQHIILASQSPRRKELLENAGLAFDILPAHIDESALAWENDPTAYAKTLSQQKAHAIARNHQTSWIIGADTIVVADQALLEKPADREDAIAMLTQLSNREHRVYTGVCIHHKEKGAGVNLAVETKVRFKALAENEIHWYADTGEPYDKAGAYGIQGIGAFMVQEIQGSYSNVVGLPVCEVISALAQLEVIQF